MKRKCLALAVGIGFLNGGVPALAHDSYGGSSGVECVSVFRASFHFTAMLSEFGLVFPNDPSVVEGSPGSFRGSAATEIMAREGVFDDCLVTQTFLGRTYASAHALMERYPTSTVTATRHACRAEARRAVCEPFRHRY